MRDSVNGHEILRVRGCECFCHNRKGHKGGGVDVALDAGVVLTHGSVKCLR